VPCLSAVIDISSDESSVYILCDWLVYWRSLSVVLLLIDMNPYTLSVYFISLVNAMGAGIAQSV
jgi:hypothetical protein